MNSVVLLILDGWGLAPSWGGNAISQAHTPNFDLLWRTKPHATLGASGTNVGLTGHEAGNSEVGHLNIGAGRIVYQDSSKITESIKDNSFFSNKILLEACEHVKKNHSSLHLMGLVGSGNVHSQLEHLYNLLDLAKRQNVPKVYIHAFTDGRDSDSQSAIIFFSRLVAKIKEIGIGEIASICGRFYAMDRDHHWERTELAYKAIANGLGEFNSSPLACISSSYSRGITDEFIRPTVITKDSKPLSTISSSDSVIFFNFRADRARQITRAFVEPNFNNFKINNIANLFFCEFIPYEAEKDGRVKYAFGPQNIKNTLAEVLSSHKLSQFHLAESEKYAHVTYFFNGGREVSFSLEDRLLISSPRVETYDQKPEMSAKIVTDNLLEKISSKKYSLIITNFANADMVGHTGNFKATILACEAVDVCLSKVIDKIKQTGDILIVTADHGNAEEILNPKTGEMDTEHSENDVPFVLSNNLTSAYKIRPTGILADIAPTILGILHLPKPVEMTGTSLII